MSVGLLPGGSAVLLCALGAIGRRSALGEMLRDRLQLLLMVLKKLL
ncbi:MAG TPA: hypothetical protein PLM77_12215 [Phycisphaerae bacterium]|nr:hypothetical protein [Phycisphaerae bacterium]